MKIKLKKYGPDFEPEMSLDQMSKQLKFTFGLNNRKTPRGPYRKPARWTGTFRETRVAVRSTIYDHRGKAKGSKQHIVKRNIDYLTRDSVKEFEREGESLVINDHEIDWENDRYHYMLIITPEHPTGLNLDELTRDIVSEMQHDLGTKLDWFAAEHRNTDHPHVHLMIRGKDDQGNDLEIRTQYLHRVAPQIATEIANIRLCPELSHVITRQPELTLGNETQNHRHIDQDIWANRIDSPGLEHKR